MKDESCKSSPLGALKELPIALFDSGVGGLTVFKAISEILPSENLLYLGDTARLPYGTKSDETIIQYTRQAAHKLMEYGAKMLIIACNTATSAALPSLASAFDPLPVLGVVEAGAAAAASSSRNGRIAVIATEATIRAGAYQKAISQISPQAIVQSRACTLFVPMAEEGWLDGPLVEGIIQRYIGDIFNGSPDAPDTLLLGCTHFPILRGAMRKVLGSQVHIVDSASMAALNVQKKLGELNMLNGNPHQGTRRFLTTDNIQRFAHTGSLFLERTLREDEIEMVNL